MKFIHRFYGSCGHEVDTESKELFDKFAAPREVKSIVDGKPMTVQNDVTTEPDGTKIVHVHPDRYCTCLACIEADLKDEQERYERLSVFMPKVRAKDEPTWQEVKRVLRETKASTLWISNEERWVSFEKHPPRPFFLIPGATIEEGIGLKVDEAVDEIVRLVESGHGAKRELLAALLRRLDVPDDLWTVEYLEPHTDQGSATCNYAFYTLARNQAEVLERLPELPGRKKLHETWYAHHHTRGGRIVPLDRVGEAAAEFLKDKCLHEPTSMHGGERRCRQCGRPM